MGRHTGLTDRQPAPMFDLPTDEAVVLHHCTLSDDALEIIRARAGYTTGPASPGNLVPCNIPVGC